MKKSIIISFFCISFFLPMRSFAQWTYGANAHYGFLILHHPYIEHLAERHIGMMEIYLNKENNGKTPYQRIHPKTSWGLAYSFADLGSRRYLGFSHSLFAYMNFPYLVRRKFSLTYRLGTGIGIITKPFDRNTNYHNNAIGSYFNETVTMLNEAKYRYNEHWTAKFGMGFTHFSNGTAELPNLGLNIATLFAGVSYTPKHIFCNIDTVAHFVPSTEVDIISNLYMKEDYPLDNKRYIVNSTQVLLVRNSGFKYRWGGGFDYFYDSSLKKYMEKDGDTTNNAKTASQIGIVASFEVVIGRLSLPLQSGVYAYDNYKLNGWLYTRIGLRYRLAKRMIANFSLKTHYGRADYFELGLGMRL